LLLCNLHVTNSTSARIYWTTLVTCAGWSVVIVYRLSPIYRAFVPFINQPSRQWTCPACHFEFFVGICQCFINTCARFNDDTYFQTSSDWHFHVMSVLTTTRKNLFTTVTIRQMTSYFQVTSGIHIHTFPWILTFICSI
jgi:hypothetical protein